MYREHIATVDELVARVQHCCALYDSYTLGRIWQCLTATYNLVLENKGGNNFVMPHTGIRKRQQAGDGEDNSAKSEVRTMLQELWNE